MPRKPAKQWRCVDCKKKVYRYSTRCRVCDAKFKTKVINLCINCGKKIRPQSTRCKLCSNKNLKIIRQKNCIQISKEKQFRVPSLKCTECGKPKKDKWSKWCPKCGNKLKKKKHTPSPPRKGVRLRYKGNLMRSTWEVAYAIWLDERNIKWLYEPQTFSCGKTFYTPDFFLEEENRYVEIKGWFTAQAKRKIAGFRKYNPLLELEILQKAELTKLGVLSREKMEKVRVLCGRKT